jgi:acyl dehydratase
VKWFEDFVVGEETIGDETYVVTEAEICEVSERWDPPPGDLVASPVHLFAIWVAVSNRLYDEPVAAVSALGFDELRLHAPARPGDELRVQVVVTETRPSNSRPELGIVRTRSGLVNQREEQVFSAASASLIRRRPEA